jgi:hypothetical protein
MLIMAGANGIILSLFYALLDFTAWQPAWMRRKWKPSDRSALAVGPTDMLRPFVWVGMNTIFIYLFSPSGDLWERLQGNIYWDTPDNNLVTATYRNVFCHAPYVIIQGTTINQGHCHIGNGCRCGVPSIFFGHGVVWLPVGCQSLFLVMAYFFHFPPLYLRCSRKTERTQTAFCDRILGGTRIPYVMAGCSLGNSNDGRSWCGFFFESGSGLWWQGCSIIAAGTGPFNDFNHSL